MTAQLQVPSSTALNNERVFKRSLRLRHMRGNIWRTFFASALVVGMLALVALFGNILNAAVGYVILNYEVAPEVVSPDTPLDQLDSAGLANILAVNAPRTLPVYIRDYLSTGDRSEFTTTPLGQLLAGRTLDPALAGLTIRELTSEQQAQILAQNTDANLLRTLVEEDVLNTTVVQTFPLVDSLFNRDMIDQALAEAPEGSRLVFKSWVDAQFLFTPLNTNAFYAGIRAALLGTVVVVIITVLIAFPIGLGAAIYLEEYASRSPIHRLIETNIRNLAGVPSIIYGLLGLAVFVRMLEGITQGRTILSASLTMSLLIMPVIIINAQEALRAVAPSIREASYGLGASKWQTIARSVIPAALPGILTGTILAMSRAIGETAPLIIIGASTFILTDPRSLTDNFTVLPIQIFRWTAFPQQEFRATAAAAIVVLLIMLLTLNATAIILRQRARRRLTG